MESLIWKIRISVLWVFMAVGMAAAMVLWFMGPGVIEEIMSGEMEGMQITAGFTILFALFWLIPLIMAFLCFILKHTANRWANFVLGVVFGVFYLFDTIGDLSRGDPFGGDMFMGIAMIVVAALIAWHAWRWPKEEA